MTAPNTSGIPGPERQRLRGHYRTALLENVVPWWEKHGPDREYTGIFSCLERDGHTYSGDKYMWMNARAVWTFSHLYNQVEKRPLWRELAELGARFMLDHAFREGGKMYFRLTREGRPLATCLSLYTEGFATIALAELSAVSGDRSLWDRAAAMYESLNARWGAPSDTALLGYPMQAQFHLHSHDMMRMTLAWVMNTLNPAPRWQSDMHSAAESAVRLHWKPEHAAMLENVSPDGEALLDLTEGRMVNPGHAIESAWMMLEIARHGNDAKLQQTAVEIILASLERGWDEQYGGLRYLLNIDGSPPHPLEVDMKLWWPHCESLYALLLAWELTGRDDLRKWYERFHEYAFRHFPDPEYGEWYGYLNRDGSPTWTAKATAWKCFFHLPRTLLRCCQLLDEGI
ncbi:MAG: AGE family epimerase/isomerase [Pirellulales bacterium]|nr:AGE family epimerase/isomerase [Pirellulales bacterium]